MRKEWVDRYVSLRPTFVKFTEHLSVMIRELMEGDEIPNVLQARTKEVEKFARKIARPDKNYERFEEVTDLTALRVLTYILGDSTRVRAIIEREFKVDWPNTVDKRRKLKPNQLGYDSINYVVSLTDLAAESFPQFAALKAEVQVGTLLSHVWSEIQHPYYKGETTVPPELERRLFLVRGLLEVADLELQDFKDKEAQLSVVIGRDVRTKAAIPLSTTALSEYIAASDYSHELIASASKAGFDVMSSPEEPLSIVSDLVNACQTVGIRTTDQLEKFLAKNSTKAPIFFKELDARIRKKENVPWSVGGAYLIIFLLIAAFPNKLNEEYFARRGWASRTVNLIKSVPLE
jgi:ppGpp synthetase/RelA/SpoT-type nucleotidyltranferase